MKNTLIAYKDIPLFRGIEEASFNPLFHCLKSYVRAYRKGEYILLDQDHIQKIGVVLTGTVHMLKEDAWGNQTLLSYMNQGELLGESFALRPESSSFVSFLSASNTEILFLSFSNVLHTCRSNCSFHQKLIDNLFQLVSLKNQQLMEKIEITSRTSLREKILAFLSLEAQHQASRYLTISLSRTEMAQYLCTNRSAMTRELSSMKEEGLIDFDRNTFILKK